MILAALAWALGGPAASAATLHVVIAADSSAPGIGPDMEVGRRAIRDAVIVNTPEAMCDLREVPARGLGRAAMIRAIQGLPVGPDDAILFYYLGHGAYSPSYGTYTTASGDGGQKGLYLSELRDAVAARRPRFGAVILDCCNTLRPVPGESAPSAPLIEHPQALTPLFGELFFGRPGLLTVTSSAPREYAIVLPSLRAPTGELLPLGSLFTREFTGLLVSASADRPAWDRLLGRTQESMDWQFRRHCRGGAIPLGNGQVVRRAGQTVTSRWN